MTPLAKGLIIAAVHAALIASLGAKLYYDRGTRPRVWARTAPYDPDLPIRGRYVRLQLLVEPRGIEPPTGAKWQPPRAVSLRVENDRLVGVADPARDADYSSSDIRVSFINRRGEKFAVLEQAIAYFIPEHVTDPSVRASGEELWVEVTIPKTGPPRPIRLGVKKGDAPITPLEMR